MTSEEIESYCAELREVFNLPGWKWIEAECVDVIKRSNDIDLLDNSDHLYAAKGAKAMAQQILNLPVIIEQLEAELDEDDDASDADD